MYILKIHPGAINLGAVIVTHQSLWRCFEFWEIWSFAYLCCGICCYCIVFLHHFFWFLSYKLALLYSAHSPQPAGFIIMFASQHQLHLNFILSFFFLYLFHRLWLSLSICKSSLLNTPFLYLFLIFLQVLQHSSRSVWLREGPVLSPSASPQPAGSPHC